ncbi:MAG TPA: tetratricopeptide repeat protein, partial [Silvibacterium sp.]|nr:tetratricopeptide repeat protein [Silvibacterium sp.]
MRAGFWIGAALICALAAAPAVSSASMSRESADAIRTALNRGRADEALQLLDKALKADPNDAEALNLRCRVYYAEERWDDAIGACERAVQIAPGNSSYHLWLGRAYGGKAQQVALVAAYKMAKLIRAEFEMAANLDPKNGDALSDLGQFYAQAPVIVGGGYGKAEGVARQLDAFAPVRALELRAQIAEEKKDYADAEKALREKISVSHSAAQSWMDLGSFYERRGRWDEMLAALESGSVAADRDHGSALADGSAVLMAAGREPRLAIEWMRAYLGSNALNEEAPAFVVHARIG